MCYNLLLLFATISLFQFDSNIFEEFNKVSVGSVSVLIRINSSITIAIKPRTV